MRGLGRAAVTSGSLLAAGDGLAQALGRRRARRGGAGPAAGPGPSSPDAVRTARMASFGLAFYGPLQHFWYDYLDRMYPLKTHVPHFLAKVGLNQVVLGPVVITSLFAWDLALQGRSTEVPDKVRSDLLNTAVNGWKFWVPASAVNFYAVPLQYQVLYMSCAGLVWSTYLSYSSNK